MNTLYPLIFPHPDGMVLAAQTRLRVDNLNDCIFEFEPTPVPQATKILNKLQCGQNFFNELNYFAKRVSDMNRDDRVLLNGAIAIHMFRWGSSEIHRENLVAECGGECVKTHNNHNILNAAAGSKSRAKTAMQS